MQRRRGSRNHGDRFLLLRKAAPCHRHLVIAHRHRCKQKRPSWSVCAVCVQSEVADFSFTAARPLAGAADRARRSYRSKYGGKHSAHKKKYDCHDKQNSLHLEFFSVEWRENPRRVAWTRKIFHSTKISGKLQGDERRARRGEGGANDCTNSFGAKVPAAIVASDGWPMVAGSGVTKIAGAARI